MGWKQAHRVGQHPGRVVMIVVAGDKADVSTVTIATVQGGHSTQPAVHDPSATAGTEHDSTVGQIRRLDIVVRSIGQLSQAAAVDVDFVEVISVRATLAVRKENFLGIVVNLGITDASPRVIQQHIQLTIPKIQTTQPSTFAKTHAVRRIAVVPEVDVPMVFARNTHGKNDFINAGHRTVQMRLKECSGTVFDLWSGVWRGPGGGKRRADA